MELKDIRYGDSVRLRNGEVITVDSVATAIHDRDGEHEGPFVIARPGFDHYVLADVLEVVVRNPRVCIYCGEGVTSTVPETKFCRNCFYTGRAHEERRSDLIGRLGDIPEVATVSVWHTGGGCFLLAVIFGDDSQATITDGEAGLPEGAEMWGLIVVAPDSDAWDEWDEDRLDLRESQWDDDALVREIAQIAKGRS